MNKKFLSRLNNSEDKCIVHRNAESKTFSKFVDKVIDEFPGTISSKVVPAFPKDANNPYDVLRNKGFLDISQNTLKASDCSSDVKLNFYSEETRCGETVKVFMSDHHFKDGKLVYSSTHELLPDRQPECQNINRWKVRHDSRINSQSISSKSVRKKLTDILQENEKQKSIQYYEKERRKRAYSKPLPPASFCGARSESHEKHRHTLHSEHIHGKAHPSIPSKSRRPSPERVRCFALYKVEPASRYLEEPSAFVSSSQISISSNESWTYSSPKGVVKKISSRDEKYKRIVSLSPQRKFRNDLFVIPEHTCHKIPQEILKYRHRKSSHWDTIRRLVATPRFKYNVYHRIMESSMDHEKERYDPKTSDAKTHYAEYRQDSSASSSSDDSKMRNGEDFKRYSENKDKQASRFAPAKNVFRQNHETVLPLHNIRFQEHKDNNNKIGKPRNHKERQDNSPYDKNHVRRTSPPKAATRVQYDKSPYRSKRFKEGVRKVQVLRQPYSDHESYTTATEGESDSDKGSRTLPFEASSEADIDRGVMNQDKRSTDSKTSVCTLHDNNRNGGFRRKSSNHVKKTTYYPSHEGKEQYAEGYKDDFYEDRDAPIKTGKEHESLDKNRKNEEDSTEKKRIKKRREINPNKVVQFDDSGKRVSHYFDSIDATLGTDAFEDKRKIYPEKAATCQCSPKTLAYGKVGRRDKSSRKITYKEESLENCLRRAFHQKKQTHVDLMQNTVNKEALTEYREKQANFSCNRNKRETGGNAERKKFEYRRTVNKEYKTTCHHKENCDACEIEKYNN